MATNKINTSIDCVIFGFENATLKVLLIKRNNEPQKGVMALPGDFIGLEEDIDDSAARALQKITNLSDLYLEQIRAFGTTDRFPSERVITIGYYSLINIEKYEPMAGHTAELLEWCDVHNLPQLAFDHRQIVDAAMSILKRKVRHEPVGFNLLPDIFSITELQQLYEAVLNTALNKRNFRTKLAQMKLLIDTGKKQENVSHKPAQLYRFDEKVYADLIDQGFYFKL